MVLLSVNEKQLFQVITDWNVRKYGAKKQVQLILNRNWNGHVIPLSENVLQCLTGRQMCVWMCLWASYWEFPCERQPLFYRLHFVLFPYAYLDKFYIIHTQHTHRYFFMSFLLQMTNNGFPEWTKKCTLCTFHNSSTKSMPLCPSKN